MVILGLTGSIGMGKSTAARMLRRMGVPVNDADANVHRLFAPGGAAVPLIEAAFPGVVRDGRVDRQALGARVLGNVAALERLEDIVHPLVRRMELEFLKRAARRGAKLVVLDIPLLFETGGDRRVDAVVVVTAPVFLQRIRVLRRPGMTPEKLRNVLARQMPDREKRRRADFEVQTGDGRYFTLRALRRIVKVMSTRHGRHWPPPGWQPTSRPKERPHAGNRSRYRDHRA